MEAKTSPPPLFFTRTQSCQVPLHVLVAAGSCLGLLRLEAVVEHLHGHIDVAGLAGNGNETLVGVGSLAGARGGARLRNADLAVGLRADLVDLDTSLTDDCVMLASSKPRLSFPVGILTGSDERVGNKDLLRLAAGSSSVAGGSAATSTSTVSGRGRVRVLRGLLAVRASASRRAGVALLVVEENGTNVVHGNVDGIGDTRDGENALHPSVSTAHTRQSTRTSVDPGSMTSLALSLAPEASWISLILLPPLPILREKVSHALAPCDGARTHYPSWSWE